ncbi:cobalamin B12-binding domain-containing protein [Sporomusa acidovorans]|uniref:Methionine synthase n=1 Tax=Sporomusa acidovorans (strain ATCC 49682 / DSM 3132 / Mol) TaxID=1123286 RepID=A0ABZ3IXQ5_SPOA4|nr:corrinoid protein [Sporomusa acidovorans]OZC22394.1 methionine synthase [Sporomusa acidovorans DSM 3132]SDE47908.1 5-methyltetrahydrofolate--homocysteine methyltransferase [Sporomusa acidovorans]
MDFNQLSLYVQKGNGGKVKEMVSEGLAQKVSPTEILNEGLIAAMTAIGEKFKNNEIYVPEMLMAAKAMNAGMQVLEPVLTATGVKPIGKAVIGTVKGDLHDIGKNLVRMMLKGAGIEMYDLGIDVPAQAFLAKAKEVGADMICLSALLTTTMPYMDSVIKEFEKAGVRGQFVFMIGGAPVTEAYAKSIHADCYAEDAVVAVDVAKKYLAKKQ